MFNLPDKHWILTKNNFSCIFENTSILAFINNWQGKGGCALEVLRFLK